MPAIMSCPEERTRGRDLKLSVTLLHRDRRNFLVLTEEAVKAQNASNFKFLKHDFYGDTCDISFCRYVVSLLCFILFLHAFHCVINNN